MNNIEIKQIEIKEKIHIINPTITDELLDLLCEYVHIKNELSNTSDNHLNNLKPYETKYMSYQCGYTTF